jgi:hypothetical protein
MNWQDIGIRAAKTFGQAFLAVLLAANVASLGDLTWPLLDAALVAGLAALASFANNAVLGAGSNEPE